MRLPPDDDFLKQHITRANFLAYIQRHRELRDHPSPVGYGWTLVNARCRPVRHTQQAIPPELHTPSTPQAGDGSSGDESESEVSYLPHFESERPANDTSCRQVSQRGRTHLRNSCVFH